MPYELTVQLLTNALIANPAKNYLIDGFPRAVDQAIYFEQNVSECQTVLFYEVEETVLEERCMARAKSSGRADDNPEPLKKRFQAYTESTRPVVDMYSRFGKVRHIDASGDVNAVYKLTKEALLPEIYFLVGTKASGKTTLGKKMAERTNMSLLNFTKFVNQKGLKGADDDEIVFALIAALLEEIHPRVLLEGFPQNEMQAKCFLKNCMKPSHAFYLKCSKDACQERMIDIGKHSKDYISSSVLAQMGKEFHRTAPALLKFLGEHTNFHVVDAEQSLELTFKEMCTHVEPTIVHIRSGPNADLKKEMLAKLVSEHGFINLEVTGLIRDETERRTKVGQEFLSMVSQGKIIPAEMIVKMLRKIIFSGQRHDKFLLTSFPEIVEHVEEFEASCASLSAIFLTTTGEPTVELKGNNLTLFNIDSLLQKQYRLKKIANWDYKLFQELLGNKFEYVLVGGNALAGKSTVSAYLRDTFGFEVVSFKALEAGIKARLGSEEEPFEGEIPLVEFIAEMKKSAAALQGSRGRCVFAFDDFPGADKGALAALVEAFGLPEHVLELECERAVLDKRFMTKNEIEGEIGEEQREGLNREDESWKAKKGALEGLRVHEGRVRVHIVPTDVSAETTHKQLNALFAPRVVVVNHEKRLVTDTTCANLAIKYNMVYVSVYQLIRRHLQDNTSFGKKLAATRKPKEISI